MGVPKPILKKVTGQESLLKFTRSSLAILPILFDYGNGQVMKSLSLVSN